MVRDFSASYLGGSLEFETSLGNVVIPHLKKVMIIKERNYSKTHGGTGGKQATQKCNMKTLKTNST